MITQTLCIAGIFLVAIAVAYVLGRVDGYWKRAAEERKIVSRKGQA